MSGSDRDSKITPGKQGSSQQQASEKSALKKDAPATASNSGGQIAQIVDTIFSTVKTALGEGRPVRIKNFGVFEIRSRPSRKGVNPANGEEIIIRPSRGLAFRPARLLKKLVAPVTEEKR